MRRRHLLIISLSLAVLAAACGSTNEGVVGLRSDTQSSTDGVGPSGSTDDTVTAGTDNPDTTGDTGDAAFGWKDYRNNGAIQTGHLTVPIDYKDPSKGNFTLAVARHKATNPSQRIGSLLVDPGGPGFGGTDFALQADNIYSKNLLAHFDIIAWDPRGTGSSTPAIDCVTDYDHFFAGTDITPDDDAERQQIVDLAKEFETDCVTKNAKILQYVGTNNSARDMDSIRKALGEDTISYFGFSYGSELGATWATLFPTTVRAAVLDGAADPTADFLTSGLQQSKGFEGALTTFLASCDKDEQCPFSNGGKSEAAFDALMLAIDAKPIPTETGRPDLTRSMALTAVAEAMYSESSWPDLEQGLADAKRGDGAGLLALYDEYYQRQPNGTYDNSLEAFQVISCMDEPTRITVAEDDSEAAQYRAVAPRFSPSTVGTYFCTFFPKSDDPRVTITGKGAGPILVVGTTGDPATPLAASTNMAKALEGGVLLTVVGNQHTGYDVNNCSVTTVDNYLIKHTVPKVGTRCA